ncbi:MAG TPA: beta-galactosidase [Terriglobales bacterium]|nr:beta-galactosidase [Terriglobales bacterium]
MKAVKIAAVLLVCSVLGFAQSGQKKVATPKPASVTSASVDHSKPTFFPVSVWYSGGKARAPMLDRITADSPRVWKEDLLKIKGLGFNTVRTWVEWNVGEPRDGEYHLENLDLLLKLAQEVGLKVIVQVYVDSAPQWVGKKYPDGHYAAQDGQPIKSQAAPGYCIDHRGVRKAILGFYSEVARHAEKSPAFFGYDLWSEPAAMNWARIGYKSEPMFCYCPSSMERFREWLKGKYGNIDALNEAWHRTFADWSEVEPPRFGTILSYTDFMDWRIYYGYKLAEDLKMRNEAVKAVDPGHVTTSHAPNPSPLARTLADAYDPSDDFLMKDSVDYFGTSLYPKLTSVDRNWDLNRRVLSMDLTNAITDGRGFYVGELQSGYGVHGTVIGSEVTPSDMEMWAWGMVSRGARAINHYAFYPMNAGYESGGYGMVNLDGTLTERSRRAGAYAKVIDANSDLLLQARTEPAEAAVVFSPLAPLLGGYQAYGSRNATHQAVAGYHRMFFERNVPLDVLSSRELSAEKLGRYKLVIVPYPLMLTKEEASALQSYVANGGHMFVEARPGWVDERGHAEPIIPGFGWHEMLGVREKTLIPGKEFTIRWGDATIPGMSFLETFEVLNPSAKAIAFSQDGTPVGYENKYKKGSTIVFGSFPGQQNQQMPVAMNPLGGLLAQWAGLSSPKLQAPALLELRQMTADKGRLVFLFNHANTPAQVTFERTLEKPATAVREIVSGEKVNASGTNLQLKAEVPGESVRIYRIDF